MAQGTRVKKKAKNKRIFLTMITIIIIFSVIYSIPFLLKDRYKTILPEPDILYKKVEAIGLALKNETLYFADVTGEIDQKIKEGEMVPVGIEIANLSLLKDTSSLKQELLEVEEKISALNKSNKEISKIEDDKLKIESLKTNLVDEIQKNINEGNYISIYKAKENILVYDTKLQDSSLDNTLLGVSLDNLKARKEELISQINSNNLVYHTQNSGILTYNIDGYENIYLPKDFENYTYDNINIIEDKSNDQDTNIRAGTPIFKIIDNFEWYMALKVDKKNDIEQYKVGQTLTIELENGKELIGKITHINITGDNAVVVIMLNTYLHEDYNIRFVNVNIINYKKEAFKIPTKVIVEVDGKKGVYIKEINGIVKFRPISILGVQEDYTFIDKGDNNGYIRFEGDEKDSKTITLFDEIFLDSSAVKEGQILK